MSKFFGLLFVLSLSVFLFFWLSPANVETPLSSTKQISNGYAQQKMTMPSVSIENDISSDNSLVILMALGSSIFSFFGFLLSFRSNHKENQLLDLKKEREQLEMQKLQAEIDLLRKSS